jgi:hypothetical protein
MNYFIFIPTESFLKAFPLYDSMYRILGKCPRKLQGNKYNSSLREEHYDHEKYHERKPAMQFI